MVYPLLTTTTWYCQSDCVLLDGQGQDDVTLVGKGVKKWGRCTWTKIYLVDIWDVDKVRPLLSSTKYLHCIILDACHRY